jgi:hypothetical protein
MHLYNYLDADLALITGTFFCLIILLGPFFLLNLILAVILGSFNSIQNMDEFAIEDSHNSMDDMEFEDEEEIEHME